jgi:hypothetical protein
MVLSKVHSLKQPKGMIWTLEEIIAGSIDLEDNAIVGFTI